MTDLKFGIGAQTLLNALQAAALFAIKRGFKATTLGGVLIDRIGDDLLLVATDGAALIKIKLTDPDWALSAELEVGEDVQYFLSNDDIKNILPLLKAVGKSSPAQFSFSIDGLTISAGGIDSSLGLKHPSFNYPEYSRIFSSERVGEGEAFINSEYLAKTEKAKKLIYASKSPIEIKMCGRKSPVFIRYLDLFVVVIMPCSMP